jgi:hypothetical protein
MTHRINRNAGQERNIGSLRANHAGAIITRYQLDIAGDR